MIILVIAIIIGLAIVALEWIFSMWWLWLILAVGFVILVIINPGGRKKLKDHKSKDWCRHNRKGLCEQCLQEQQEWELKRQQEELKRQQKRRQEQLDSEFEDDEIKEVRSLEAQLKRHEQDSEDILKQKVFEHMDKHGKFGDAVMYVLALKSGYYYVGLRSNPKLGFKDRIDKHFNGEGAKFTQEHRPIGIKSVYLSKFLKGSTDDEWEESERYEDALTIKMMRTFGIGRVRGGHFSRVLKKDNKERLREYGWNPDNIHAPNPNTEYNKIFNDLDDFVDIVPPLRSEVKREVNQATSEIRQKLDEARAHWSERKATREAIHASAKRGDVDAQFKLSSMYETGSNAPKDSIRAFHWLTEASKQGGDLSLQYKMAQTYRDSSSEYYDEEKGMQLISNIARHGYAEAQHSLGEWYQRKGDAQSLGYAAQWFYKAAVQGVVDAQYSLALLYHKGEGVPQDLSHAEYWFTRAAESGHVAPLLAKGEGVPQDLSHAEYLTRAAESGHAALLPAKKAVHKPYKGLPKVRIIFFLLSCAAIVFSVWLYFYGYYEWGWYAPYFDEYDYIAKEEILPLIYWSLVAGVVTLVPTVIGFVAWFRS